MDQKCVQLQNFFVHLPQILHPSIPHAFKKTWNNKGELSYVHNLLKIANLHNDFSKINRATGPGLFWRTTWPRLWTVRSSMHLFPISNIVLLNTAWCNIIVHLPGLHISLVNPCYSSEGDLELVWFWGVISFISQAVASLEFFISAHFDEAHLIAISRAVCIFWANIPIAISVLLLPIPSIVIRSLLSNCKSWNGKVVKWVMCTIC